MRKTPYLVISATFFTAGYFLWLLLSPKAIETYGASFLSTTAPLLSLVVQLLVLKKFTGILQRLIILFILGTISYVIAELIWNYQILFVNIESIPFPGWSDVFYYLNTSFFICAFFYLVSTNKQHLQRFSFLLDIIIIFSTCAVLLASKIFIPIFMAGGFSFLDTIVSTMYPALVLLLLISMLICISYIRVTFHYVSIILFCSALLLQLIGDTAFIFLHYFSLYSINSLLEPLWSLSILLYGIAIFSLSEYIKETSSNSDTSYQFQYSFQWNVGRLIIQSICILLLLYNYYQFKSGIYGTFLFGTIILVIVRQIISSYHIHKLLISISKINGSLEEKVLDRTEQLSLKNKELIIAVEKINYMALHDDLTGLPNRRYLHSKLNELKESEIPFSLVFLDVDKFKEINDSLGHLYGDEVLKEITKLLKTASNNQGTIFRQSGDEFILIFEQTDKTFLDEIISKIIFHSATPIKVYEHHLIIRFSIGISCFPKDTEDVIEMIKIADMAMYKAKKEGLDCYYSIK